MADVIGGQRHHRNMSSIGSTSHAAMAVRATEVEMLANPGFSFPMRPQATAAQFNNEDTAALTRRRPMSVQVASVTTPANQGDAHRRTVSTLPSFTFNAAEASGLLDNSTPPMTPTEPIAVMPTRRGGHRRSYSEYVGGDSRLGVVEAISASPTKTSALPLPASSPGPPAGRFGHAHRRSAAMSSHDVSSIMTATETQPRLSSSLPNTPLDLPQHMTLTNQTTGSSDDTIEDQFGPPLDLSRSLSKPRVGFSDEIEYIPRPLSIMSSGTDSTLSTVRGHSVNNSISSVLSLSTPSPPSSRSNPRLNLSTTFEDDTIPEARSLVGTSKRIEKEGEWLKSRTSTQSLTRPVSESSASGPSLSFAPPSQGTETTVMHRKRQSFGRVLGFDRRRSAPEISVKLQSLPRWSALSLEEPTEQDSLADGNDAQRADKTSSSRKIKAWAASMMSKKSTKSPVNYNDWNRERLEDVDGLSPQASLPLDHQTPLPREAGLETDLDAVFGGLDEEESLPADTPPPPRFELSMSIPSQHSYQSQARRLSDELSPNIDLDAALGPFDALPFYNGRPRRELHSSRGTKDFVGFGGHYPRHFRTASAPTLQSFHRGRSKSPSKSDMPVFAEEDEEDARPEQRPARPRPQTTSSTSSSLGEGSTGIHVVDTDTSRPVWGWDVEDGLRVQPSDWESEQLSPGYGTFISRLSTPIMDRRPSSIVEETIMEESVQIVSPEEEPRAPSITKSSDSSETPTILAAPASDLMLPDGHASSLATPDTYQTSTFSSPDLGRRQGSFDTSRLGTSASSIGDARTMSSFATGEHSHDNRISVDGVPSLTSSRSTVLSTMHANDSNREVDFGDRPRCPLTAGPRNRAANVEPRRKRASIASLSQLMGGSFTSKSKDSNARPHTALGAGTSRTPKKEHRLKKLMFWKSMSSGRNQPSQTRDV